MATYVTDVVGLAEVTKSWEGVVGKDLTRRGRSLEYRAKTSVGVKTGRLRRDISTTRSIVVDGLELTIGSIRVPYAAAHHEGARPHVIVPRSPSGFLRFEVAGKIVFARRVNHPGNRPNPFLSRWLREAVA